MSINYTAEHPTKPHTCMTGPLTDKQLSDFETMGF